MPARTAAPPASQDREVLRLAAPVVLWWIWIVFVAVNVGDFAIQGLSSARFGAVISAILLFVTGLAYALALRPRVITDSAGVTVLNPFRTHHVPWRLIESVDTGEWVRIRYAVAASTGPASKGPASTGPASTGPASTARAGAVSDGAAPDSAAPDGALDGAASEGAVPDGSAPDSGAPTRTLHCWALYVSARTKRKIARGTPRPRRGLFQVGGFGRARAEIEASGYATPANSRLPEEARYLASLPVAQAMASRLDTRAARERARKPRLGQSTDQATASWAWPAVAVVVIPAVILLVVALV
jgi:hypothetical protein